MKRSHRAAWLAATLVVLIGFDQFTKELALRWLQGQPAIAFPRGWAPNDLFRFQFATNTGAFLSLFAGLPASARFWLLVGLNAVVLTGIAVYLLRKEAVLVTTFAALAMILAGGVGNLIDRIFRNGEVVDFMNMGIGRGTWGLRTGIFNIADLAIVGGLVVLLVREAWPAKK
jgi:signal peptidase II